MNEKSQSIGEFIQGKGIFCGTWMPVDRQGNSLGKIFNLFAAPEDLGALYDFNDAMAQVSRLKNWHGRNGFNHNVKGKTPDQALYDALLDGSYNGEWFLPPKEVLNDNLFVNKNKFGLVNAFRAISKDSDTAHWYWSCTEHKDLEAHAWNQNFLNGDIDWPPKDIDKLSVRCVRAEPIMP